MATSLRSFCQELLICHSESWLGEESRSVTACETHPGFFAEPANEHSLFVIAKDAKPTAAIQDSSWIAILLASRTASRDDRWEGSLCIPANTSLLVQQTEKCGLDIDTRTDIYSLGVLRYERLTGVTPFNATLRLAHFGFETLELQRIEIVVAIDNAASIRVAEKVVATREGRLRDRIIVNGARAIFTSSDSICIPPAAQTGRPSVA